MEGLRLIFQNTIDEWDNNHHRFTSDTLNEFIDKYESVFRLQDSMRGLHVRQGSQLYHEQFEGVRGIVSMYIQNMKNKLFLY